jgi:LytR cell envelope-related transcriptional attenuator
MNLVDDVGVYVAFAAGLGMLLLAPLLLSQHRDVVRLREWMAGEPDHPAADLVATEAILDRAETELEALEEAMAPATPSAGLSPVARVTGDRPALERITLEREALQPHPRWRHFIAIATQPRVLGTVAVVATLIGAGAILTSGKLLGGSEEPVHQPRPGAIDPANVTVAVLNGTAVPGLAARVSDNVTENGFQRGSITNSERQYEQTVVMYTPGQQRAAAFVARRLGVQPVQPVDDATSRLIGDADVVVIAGQDRTSG